MLANNPQSALALWKEKLEEYQKQLAIAADPERKFQLGKLIEECRKKIAELQQEKRKKSRTITVISAVGGMLVLGMGLTVGIEKGQIAEQKKYLEGTWQAEVTYNWGKSYREKLHLEIEGEKVKGRATFLGRDRKIEQGIFQKGQVEFITETQEVMGQEWELSAKKIHRYRGKLVGEEIKFTLETEGGKADLSLLEFTAKKLKE